MLTSRPSSPRRTGRAVALLAVVALAVVACMPPTGQQASPTPTLAPTPTPSANPYDASGAAEGSGKGVKIGYVSYGEIVPFVFEISDGIRAQAALAGVELVECDAGLDANKVSACMKQLTEAGVKGIIQFQGTLVNPVTVCGETPDVPVVAVEFAQDPCADVLVSADDLRAGQIAGTAVGEWVKAEWSCDYDAYVSFESTAAASKSRLRMEGYRQGFSSVCPIKNEQIGPSVDTESGARKAIGDVLTQLPSATKIVVVGVNGDAAVGALDGTKSAGREGGVWVSGQGAETRYRERIRTDKQYLGDAAYFPERYGRTIVPALLDLIAGKEVPKLLLVEPAWVNAENIGEYYPQ